MEILGNCHCAQRCEHFCPSTRLCVYAASHTQCASPDGVSLRSVKATLLPASSSRSSTQGCTPISWGPHYPLSTPLSGPRARAQLSQLCGASAALTRCIQGHSQLSQQQVLELLAMAWAAHGEVSVSWAHPGAARCGEGMLQTGEGLT